MKISDMTDSDRRQYLDRCYQHALNLHADGELGGVHPARVVNSWMKRGMEREAARDANGADPAFAANTGVPKAESKVTVDGQLEYDAVGNARFLAADGRVLHGVEAVARASLAIKDNVAERLDPVIPGYSRLK